METFNGERPEVAPPVAGNTPAALSPSTITVIRPEPSTHGKVVKLSAIDQIAPRDYISVCLFIKLAPDADIRRIFRILEVAMLNTVNDIPELASCVQKCTDNGREEVELLFDTTKGVEIHFKDYTSPELRGAWHFGTFDELAEEHFPINKLPRHIVYGTSAKLTGNARLPSLVMQANFIPGGLILGNCLHHVAGDGVCNFLWHKTMGAHFTAIADGMIDKPECPVHFLERTGVVEGDRGMKVEEFPNWKFAEDTENFLNPTKYDAADIPKFEYATYFISAEKLAHLKSRVSANLPEFKLCTTEALGAFLWRHVVVARQIDSKEYPEAKLSITIDARGRMEGPKIPDTYWGNLAEPNAVARLPVATLQQMDTSLSPSAVDSWKKTYPEAARKIHGAIAAVDNKAVRRLVGLLNQMPKSTTLTWNVNRWPGPDMLIVCVQAHRFNDIKFGRDIGYPAAMRCTVGDTEGKPDGRCIILPPRREYGRGLEISLQYDSDTLNRLESNEEFREYFERRN